MNHGDDRLDLSSLDPSRDPKHWDSLVASVAARGRAARCRRHTVATQMAAWAGPVLAAAAAIALVSWAGAAVRDAGETSTSDGVQVPAYVLSTWAANDERPEPTEILTVLGDNHGSD